MNLSLLVNENDHIAIATNYKAHDTCVQLISITLPEKAMAILKRSDDIDETKRALLVQALAAGLFASISVLPQNAQADLLGRVPKKLPAGQSIYRIKGRIRVNGQLADENTRIDAAATIESEPNSQLIFAVGDSAFLLRDNSHLTLKPQAKVTGSQFNPGILHLIHGALLSVFGPSNRRIVTPSTTIGIRGTGLYAEADPDKSYICTCYGVAKITATADAGQSEVIRSIHHDAPRYILADTTQGRLILPAPFKNHNDEELSLIEALVGRTTPFSFSGGGYSRPRRRDY